MKRPHCIAATSFFQATSRRIPRYVGTYCLRGTFGNYPIEKFIDIVNEKLDGLDILINNSGITLDYNVLVQDDGQLLKNYINGTVDKDPPYNIMPPTGNEPLTDCEKLEILTWIENGMD